jgi:hypothetical protein
LKEEIHGAIGQLGSRSGVRFLVYERLKGFVEATQHSLFPLPELNKIIKDIYRYPLQETAKDILNRQLRAGISDNDLADLTINLYEMKHLW